ncbi:50S ribosomal protein L29 [Symmachiella macrocystis]|uniref:Large ribosomal subunit protein uL29 n=1 Tax=Symmachiella macrocystis TaxID=2527985 RepID=A0A5C6BT25_9PLAN|nr:50S ribosomal protein L29 [Symmachiella macrocystis]TWU13844.1 50S ribosomal protein L29 [Symmachiella macrocystis]
MTKPQELREMSDEQLAFTLREAQQELFRLRFQAAAERSDAPSALRKIRRDIARIHTIARQRELAQEAEANLAPQAEA